MARSDIARQIRVIASLSTMGWALAASPAWAQGAPSGVASESADAPGRGELAYDQAIVVTAQKRAESVLDVPAAVTAVSQEVLLERGATTISEISAFTPGLQVGSGRAGTVLTIRGINSGNDPAAATGVIVDGAPIGSSSAFASGGSNAFDLDPSDIQRVEVLRGPQGTLYGASTLGGLVSYVTRRASTSEYSAFAGGEVGWTENGKSSYVARGAIDAPIVKDRVGLRVSGFKEHRGGFIDNRTTGGENLNDMDKWGARVALTANLSDNLQINVWGAHQRLEVEGPEYILTNASGKALAGDYDYNARYNPNRSQKAAIVNGSVDLDLGKATLSYIGSYQDITADVNRNASLTTVGTVLATAGALGLGPRWPQPITLQANFQFHLKKNSHELRLTSDQDGPLRWIVGGFFTFEDATQFQNYIGRTPAGAVVSSLSPALTAGLISSFREYAAFGNVTWEIARGLELTGGIRVGRNEQRYQQTGSGPSLAGFNAVLRILTRNPNAGLPTLTAVAGSKENNTNYLANLAYHFGDRSMVFARFATGYRPGGPNTVVSGGESTFEPDTVDSYEVGYKGEILDRRLRIELAAYRIDWKNIQVVRSVNGLNTRDNGGPARSQGVEFALTAFPTKGLVVSVVGAYGDTEVREAIAEIGARKGDPLPYAPNWTTTATVDYDFPITNKVSGILGGVVRMVGDRNSSFPTATSFTNIRLDSYAVADLRAGVRIDGVELTAFARNLTNSQARLAGFTELQINEVNVIRPRTIGLAASARF